MLRNILTDVLDFARQHQDGRVSGQITPVSRIVTEVLDLARSHQFARVTDDVTTVTFSERLGWSRSKVSDYSSLINNIVAEVLELAKAHQEGRAPDILATATFSEGWFRNSDLYDLSRTVLTSTPKSGTPFKYIRPKTHSAHSLLGL